MEHVLSHSGHMMVRFGRATIGRMSCYFVLVTVCGFVSQMTCSSPPRQCAGQEFRVVHAEEDEDEKNLLWLRTSQAVLFNGGSDRAQI